MRRRSADATLESRGQAKTQKDDINHRTPANLAERNRTLCIRQILLRRRAAAQGHVEIWKLWKLQELRECAPMPYQIYDLDSPSSCHFRTRSLMHWNDAPTTVHTFIFHSTKNGVENFPGF